MSLAWDPDAGRVVIERTRRGRDEAEDDEDERTDDGPRPVLRVRLTGAAARAFTKRALAVVAAGRPPCPFCNSPLDPRATSARAPTATAADRARVTDRAARRARSRAPDPDPGPS